MIKQIAPEESCRPESRWMAVTRATGSGQRAALLCDVSEATMRLAIHEDPGLAREYRLMMDDLHVAKLLAAGYECGNGCGPVMVRQVCPECGEIKRKARGGKR